MFARVTFAATLMLVVAACSGSTATESVATSTTQEATATSLGVDSGVRVLDPVETFLPGGQQLSVGDYTTTLMRPTVRFSTREPWDFRGEFESLLLLGQRTSRSELNFVLFPTYSGETVIDAIQSEEIFLASEVVPATVGGIDGVSFVVDVVVAGGGSSESVLFPNNQIYSLVDLDPPSFVDGDRIGFTVIEIGEEVLVIMAESESSGFRDFLEQTDELLASVRFG